MLLWLHIRFVWLKNGWRFNSTGRDLTKSCGHEYYVGWGISDKQFKKCAIVTTV